MKYILYLALFLSFIQIKALTKDSIINVAHWNIGHFSLGKSHTTALEKEHCDSIAALYHCVIDSIDADIIGICEYNSLFTKGGYDSSLILFGNYKYDYIGTQHNFFFNAIFSKTPLHDKEERKYTQTVARRLATISTFELDSTLIYFVEVHLDWNQGDKGAICRTNQIKNLIEWFSGYDHVIICGDFNTRSNAEFQPFVDAGFLLSIANENQHDFTYPAKNPKAAIDNIIVKGFDILSTEVITDATLSDHCLITSKIKLKQ